MRLRFPLTLALTGAALVACTAAFACPQHGTAACCAPQAKPAAYVPLPSAPPAPMPFAVLPSAQMPVVVDGLRAFLDPETGLLGGPIGDLSVPQDYAQATVANPLLVPVRLPDGSEMLDLQGTLLDYMVLQIDPLGHRTMLCVPAPALIAAPAPRPTVAPSATPYAER